MLKRLCRIGVSLAVALNSFSVVMPTAFADGNPSQQTIAGCTFEIQTNYKTIQQGTQYKLNLVNFTGETVGGHLTTQMLQRLTTMALLRQRKKEMLLLRLKRQTEQVMSLIQKPVMLPFAKESRESA